MPQSEKRFIARGTCYACTRLSKLISQVWLPFRDSMGNDTLESGPERFHRPFDRISICAESPELSGIVPNWRSIVIRSRE